MWSHTFGVGGGGDKKFLASRYLKMEKLAVNKVTESD